MNDFADRLDGLSDKKQQLLRQLLAAKNKSSSSEPLAPRPADSVPPPTHAQRGLWFLQRLAPESSFYHMPYAVHLAGSLDVSALERAFNRVVERHESLRTGFPDVGGKPVQRIAPVMPLPVPLVDLQDRPAEGREAIALRMASEESLLPFDFTNGPLLRVVLYRLGTDEHLLMFSMHHIISDGWSIGVMMSELAMLYEAFRHGLPDPLPVLPVQYGDYALWREQRIQGGALEDQLAYWRERLEGVQPIALATDFPRPAVQSFRGATVPVEIPETVTAALEAFARGHDATLFMTLLAAFKSLLFLHSGTRRMAVGTPVANREPKETEPLIGFFANTLALATDCSGDPTFAELLERVRETTMGAFKHQEAPFEMLVEALGVERDPSRNPLFQVMFGLQAVAMREFSLPGLEASPRNLDNDTTHFDMELHLWHREQQLGGYLSYNADLFERATIEHMLDQLLALLEAVTADAGRPLSALGLAAGIDPATVSPAGRIEKALLAQPAVEECAVLSRERDGVEEAVAYVVTSRPLDLNGELDALRRALPTPPVAIVPISAIPRNGEGEVDEAALRALPVIDDELIGRWERSLRALDGIAEARVSVEEPESVRPWLHLADLPAVERRAAPFLPEEDAASVTESFEPLSRGEAPPAYRGGGPLELPPEAPRTLSEALLRSAADHPEHGLLLIQEGDDETFLTYPELLRSARAILAGLQARGLKAGDRVILQFSRLADHFSAFWACVLGGIVPVTVALAPSYRERGGVVNKLWNVWKLLHQPVLLSDGSLAPRLAEVPGLFDGEAGGFRIWEVEGLRGDPEAACLYQADPEDLVFLQLTSGSTGIPKCVQETHRAIVHHVHGSQRFNGYTSDDVSLNWLPLDHVVPILTCHLKDTYLGLRQIQVATQVVLSEPLRWLDLIEAHRVTHTWAPNFGFKLINDRLARISVPRRWDLSSIRFFMNAGEQVTLPVVEEFLRHLAPFGVAPRTMQPAFGMAEVSTCMTYQNGFDAETAVHRIAKSSLGGTLRPAEGDEQSVTFVGLGAPMPGVEIRIADEENRVVPERVIGRLQIRGKVVMPGYLDNEEANREALVGDGWFDSGDLGFMHDGRLALTGRAKETIIIRGANFYCYEVEEVVNGVEGVEPTFSAACAVAIHERGGEEGLALFFVPRSGMTGVDPELIKRIRGEVSRQLGVAADYIVPLERAAFPKTTSGKIQRMQLKRGLEAGEFDELNKAVDRAEENANCLPDWFFRRAWRPQPLRTVGSAKTPGVTLLFADQAGLAERLAGEGAGMVRVEPGAAFECVEPDHYRIDPHRAEDYRLLLAAVEEEGRTIGRILHLWSYGDPAATDFDTLEEIQFRGSNSLLFLAQALASNPASELSLYVVSGNLQTVTGDETLAWGHAPLLGLLRSIGREIPWLACRHIDLPGDDPATDAGRLAGELTALGKETEVAWRDGSRWAPLLEWAAFDAASTLPLRQGGLYLLSGGLGGIGRALARYLANRWQARLVLVGRTPIAGPHSLNFTDRKPDEPDERAEVLAELNALGGDVLYAAADICDGERMAEVMDAVGERWNAPLDGIFHLAGSFHTRALAEEDVDSFAEGLCTKLSGTRVLHRLAPRGSLFVHVASVNGLFGGAMAGAYSAANSFVQAFSDYQRRNGLRAVCLSFSLWDEVGMSRGYAMKEQSRAQGYLPIDAERGLHSLLIGLAADYPQLLIGLDGERPNIRHHLKRECRPLRRLRAQLVAKAGQGTPPVPRILNDRYGTPCPVEVAFTDALPSGEGDGGRASNGGSHAPPTTEMQRTIAAIWQEVLGLSSVGVQQNFFELGGQSLALIQVHSRLQEALGREIPVVDLLQYPTIGALADALGETHAKADAFDDAVRRAQRQRAGRRQRAPMSRTREGGASS